MKELGEKKSMVTKSKAVSLSLNSFMTPVFFSASVRVSFSIVSALLRYDRHQNIMLVIII